VTIAFGTPILLLLGCICAAQTSGSATNEQPLNRHNTVLEVTAVDFDIAWQQEYLYIKVQSDGMVETQILRRKSGDSRFEKADVVAAKRTLSISELQRLNALLAQGNTLRLKTTYKQGALAVIDAGTWWDIQIPRNDRPQKIHVVAFAPDLAKAAKHPYPKALLALGCTIEKIREETIGEKSNTDAECIKVLPVP
jgi:hypothetical protein